MITFSERLYKALLMLYPAEYRQEYGWLMSQFFRDVLHERYRAQGITGLVLWWCWTLFDLTLSVIEQRRKVQFIMIKSTLTQMAGGLLVAGGVLMALAGFSQFQPDDHSRYYGIYQLLTWLLAPGFMLIGLGCIGMAWRYAAQLGIYGQWTLYLTSLGAAMMGVSAIGMSAHNNFWLLWFIGSVTYTLCLGAFGLVFMRAPFLPMFRFLPLQLASGWFVMGILSNTQNRVYLLSFLMFFGTGLAWFAIGQMLNRVQRDAAIAVS